MNWTDIRTFAKRCNTFGIPVPEPIARGLHLLDVAAEHAATPSGRLLDMTDDELRDRVTNISIRLHDRDGVGANRGMAPGVRAIESGLLSEVVRDTVPLLEQIITDLRPRFDQTVAPLIEGVQRYGITYATSSDDVIDLDADTVAAYNATKRSWLAVQPIASFRVLISKSFGLEPTGGLSDDMSVLFAEGDNWGQGGRYYLEGKTQSHLDWHALAAEGIRLNGINEVHSKIETRRAEMFSKQRLTDTDTSAPYSLEEAEQTPMPSYARP